MLPPHLEFFAFSQEELSARDDCRQSTEGKHKRSRNREGTPDSSSSDGGNDDMTEDTGGVATPPLVSHCVGGGGCFHEKCIVTLVVYAGQKYKSGLVKVKNVCFKIDRFKISDHVFFC